MTPGLCALWCPAAPPAARLETASSRLVVWGELLRSCALSVVGAFGRGLSLRRDSHGDTCGSVCTTDYAAVSASRGAGAPQKRCARSLAHLFYAWGNYRRMWSAVARRSRVPASCRSRCWRRSEQSQQANGGRFQALLLHWLLHLVQKDPPQLSQRGPIRD
jgi:hypothetical protein